MSNIPTGPVVGPPSAPSANELINELAEVTQLIAHYLGMLSRPFCDDDLLSDLICELRDLTFQAWKIHGALLRGWVDPIAPEWALSALGAVSAVIELAQKTVAAAAAAVQSIPEQEGFKAAIEARRADCSAAVGAVLIGYDEERVKADVVRSATRMNGGKSVPVLGWSDGGWVQAQIEAHRALPEGYAFAPPGTLAGTKQPEGGRPPANPRDASIPQYVTLDQAAATVSRSKRTLEKLIVRKKNPLPDPDIQGGGGKPSEWDWNRIRPWLEIEYHRNLPMVFPVR